MGQIEVEGNILGQAIRQARTVLRHAIPIAIGVVCCWALYNQLDHINFSQLWQAVLSVEPWQWIAAIFATALSFWAVARYDVVAHRHFQTGLPQRRATVTGATAISVGQTVGAGAIVGAFIRWRMQPGLGLVSAAKITAFVTLTFLAAWSVITATAVLVLPTGGVHVSVPCSVLAVAFGLLGLAFFNPVLRRAGREIELPTLTAMGALLALCLLDTFAATLAFWVLLPTGIELTIAQIFPVYLIALGAALLSGTPGGVGPFELTVLALLPLAPEAELMAAILAFRMVYYALPAILGGIALLKPMTKSNDADWLSQALGDLDNSLKSSSARAELGVVRQNGGAILHCTGGVCGVVRTGQTLTTIFDPIQGHSADLAQPLRDIARDQNRIVCKYKITARHALRARKAGWTVLHVADEAMVRPMTHKLDGSKYRQLRRKLRTAEKAGVTISIAQDALPFDDMAQVSAAWEATHGGARGLSMGQFEESYVAHQKVLLAYVNNMLVGFVTFHVTAHEWCLDLMRVLPDAPDGTMHRLVQSAIEAAATETVPCLSLAAAPAGPKEHARLEAWARKVFFAKAGGAGLRQFKACFNPQWQPLYMAAPSPAQITLAALDLIRSVRRAEPLSAPQFAMLENRNS
ncbi:hypothetical protein NBRC116601_07210 [Cognatishimia sp. WU-CL00825]